MHEADLTGWRIRDSGTAHTPVGSTIEWGGCLVIEETQLGFGLGSGGSVTIYSGPVVLVAMTTCSAAAPWHPPPAPVARGPAESARANRGRGWRARGLVAGAASL